MKQWKSGLCWELVDDTIKLTSKCRDRFYFNQDIVMHHAGTGLSLKLTSTGVKTSQFIQNGEPIYFQRSGTVYPALIAGHRFGYCITENGETHKKGWTSYDLTSCDSDDGKITHLPGEKKNFSLYDIKL